MEKYSQYIYIAMSAAEVNYHMWLRNREKAKMEEKLNECKRSLGEYKRRLDECEKREKVAKVATLVAASTGKELPVEVEENIKKFLPTTGGRKKRRKTKRKRNKKKRKYKKSKKRKSLYRRKKSRRKTRRRRKSKKRR